MVNFKLIHTYMSLFKAFKNKDKYTKNALKREFKRLTLCKKTPKRKILKIS